ncbi:MAG: nucleotide sugar dehydrogenase [Anaerolineaceae bacterium]|nr:nucleotide sugar dehydrogenase [Anaerolineaceae bacterium]
MNHREKLLEKLQARSARIGIVGLGYVGLPLALEFARAGFRVTGLDLDLDKVAQLNEGRSYIPGVAHETVAPLVAAGRLCATDDYRALSAADAISICVPTPLRKTRDPDMSYILHALEALVEVCRAGQLIVLESTTWPGTTSEIILPRLQERGLVAGESIFVAFSPERIDPANTEFGVRNTPRIVGGITTACTEVAVALYSTAVDQVLPVSSPTVAEMTKLLENTFRAVNIGLVNEMALMCNRLNIDVWEVIEAAASKPFGFMPFFPGPGLGGHCIPVDPHYLSWKLKTLNYNARFIEVASEINTAMPLHVAQRISDALNDEGKAVRGARVLVLGVAFKRDVDDVRESPALDVLALLMEKGAAVRYHDPQVPQLRLPDGQCLYSQPLDAAELAAADCVVVITDHSAIDWQQVADHSALVVDTRHVVVPLPGAARVLSL